MKLAFDPRDDLPKLDRPLESPAFGWREALAQAQRLMQEEASRQRFTIVREEGLWLDREHGVCDYTVKSSADRNNSGGTEAEGVDPDTRVSALPPPEDLVEGMVRLEQFVAALEELPEACRHAFLLNRLEGLPYPESPAASVSPRRPRNAISSRPGSTASNAWDADRAVR